MHIIRVSVTFLQLKSSFLLVILKKYLLKAFRVKIKKKDSQKGIYFFWGRACFGWVGRNTANQHFLKVGLNKVYEIYSQHNRCLLAGYSQLLFATYFTFN